LLLVVTMGLALDIERAARAVPTLTGPVVPLVEAPHVHAPRSLTERTLTLEQRDGLVVAQSTLAFSTSDPAFRRFFYAHPRDRLRYADELLGKVQVTESPPRLTTGGVRTQGVDFVAQDIAIRGDQLHMTFQSEPVRLAWAQRQVRVEVPELPLLVTESDRVLLKGWRGLVEVDGGEVVSGDEAVGRWDVRRLSASVRLTATDYPGGYLDVPRWFAVLDVPLVGGFVTYLTASVVPLVVLCLIILRRPPDRNKEPEKLLWRLSWIVLTLSVLADVSWLAWDLAGFDRIQELTGTTNEDIRFVVPLALTLASVVVWLPAAFSSVRPGTQRTRGRVWRVTAELSAAGLSVAAIGGGVHLVTWMTNEPPDHASHWLWLAAVLWYLSARGVVALWLPRAPLWTVPGTAIVFGAVVAFWPLGFFPAYTNGIDSRQNEVARVAYILSATVLFLTFALLCRRVTVQLGGAARDRASVRGVGAAVAVAVLLATVPSVLLAAGVADRAAQTRPLGWLLPALDAVRAFAPWLMLAALLGVLTQSDVDLRRRQAGGRLAAVTLVLVGMEFDHLAWLPVTAVVGYGCCLLVLRRDAAPMVNPHPAALATALQLPPTRPVRHPVASAAGGSRERLARLTLGAVVGLVVSSPLVYRQASEGDGSWWDGDFVAANFAQTQLWTFAWWPLLGGLLALLGRAVRGDTPIRRAAAVTVALTVAGLPYRIMWDNAEDWREAAVLSIEILAFSIIVYALLDIVDSLRRGASLRDYLGMSGKNSLVSGAAALVVLGGLVTQFTGSIATELGKATVERVIPPPSNVTNRTGP
jgi:hypothetical protein